MSNHPHKVSIDVRERLLTDWDDEGGEGVTADDATIVHDILWRYLAETSKTPCEHFIRSE